MGFANQTNNYLNPPQQFGVGLIKKTLEWQQILCIPASKNKAINLWLSYFAILFILANTLTQDSRGCPLQQGSIGS